MVDSGSSEKDVCESACDGCKYTEGDGTCGVCWCCQPTDTDDMMGSAESDDLMGSTEDEYMCFNYNSYQRSAVDNGTPEKDVCESACDGCIFTQGDGTCGGCWCCAPNDEY